MAKLDSWLAVCENLSLSRGGLTLLRFDADVNCVALIVCQYRTTFTCVTGRPSQTKYRSCSGAVSGRTCSSSRGCRWNQSQSSSCVRQMARRLGHRAGDLRDPDSLTGVGA